MDKVWVIESFDGVYAVYETKEAAERNLFSAVTEGYYRPWVSEREVVRG